MIICDCLLVRFNHLFLSTKMQAEIVGDIFCFRVEFSSHVERSMGYSPSCVAPFSSAVRTRPQTPNQHTKTTLNMDKASLRLSGRSERHAARPRSRLRSRIPKTSPALFSQRALIFQRG